MPRQEKTKTAIKIALIQKGITVNQLAQQIGRPRESVSKAINQGRFPRILKQIKEELSI